MHVLEQLVSTASVGDHVKVLVRLLIDNHIINDATLSIGEHGQSGFTHWQSIHISNDQRLEKLDSIFTSPSIRLRGMNYLD